MLTHWGSPHISPLCPCYIISERFGKILKAWWVSGSKPDIENTVWHIRGGGVQVCDCWRSPTTAADPSALVNTDCDVLYTAPRDLLTIFFRSCCDGGVSAVLHWEETLPNTDIQYFLTYLSSFSRYLSHLRRKFLLLFQGVSWKLPACCSPQRCVGSKQC